MSDLLSEQQEKDWQDFQYLRDSLDFERFSPTERETVFSALESIQDRFARLHKKERTITKIFAVLCSE